jgi:nucleotide-binding universal stress UspA family protein
MTATVEARLASPSSARLLPAVSLQRVLWACDFSPCAEDALRFAVPIARAYGSTVTALRVIPATTPPGASAAAVTNPALLRPHLHHVVSESLDRAVRPLKQADVPVGVALRAGDPGDEILGLAADLHADLLVVGRHGRRLVERAFLGSVAERVLGRARCPVLVVPSGATPPRTATLGQTIVWATDFSPHAAHALCYATSLAVRTGARLVLLNVVEGNLLTGEREAIRQARVRLADSVHACRSSGCDPETAVTVGSAAGEIARVATERSAGVVVMGVQGARTLHRLFCGSTAHRVIRESPCPVLAVRQT